MKFWDIFLIVILGVWLAFAVAKIVIDKKNHKGCGCSSDCASCPSPTCPKDKNKK